MPKIKTKKALLKRIKITGTGKILRSHQNRTGHLRRNKSKEALRRYHKPVILHKSLNKTVRRLLGI
ncbi:MAG: 50S ribosomal protein L35 [archaeon]|nr:50S ribosomal protein L35 [archaeon]